MEELDMGNPGLSFVLSQGPKQRERLERLYDVDFGEEDDGSFEEHKAEIERLWNREMDLAAEWEDYIAQQQADIEREERRSAR